MEGSERVKKKMREKKNLYLHRLLGILLQAFHLFHQICIKTSLFPLPIMSSPTGIRLSSIHNI